MALKNPGFKFYSCKSNSVTNSVSQRSFCHLRFLSPKISATPKLLISVSPTDRNNFSYSIPSVIKFNDSRSTCALSQTSVLSFAASFKNQQAPFSVFYSSLSVKFFSD